MLARYGYLLTRAEPEIPPSVPSYLERFFSRSAAVPSVLCCDNELSIELDLLKLVPKEKVQFCTPVTRGASGALAPGSSWPSPPAGGIVAVIDIESFPLGLLAKQAPWLQRAEALLLRARFGTFWTSELDLCGLRMELQRLGFYIADILDYPRLAAAQVPSERVIIACERGENPSFQSAHSRYRVNEALAYLSAPIVTRRDMRLLTGRGSFGFAAGVYNPGAIVEDGRVYLLSRADQTPWAQRKADESLFFTSSKPVLLALDAGCSIDSAKVLAHEGLAEPAITRTADFRLFRFRGRLYSNHSVISLVPPRSTSTRQLRMDQLQTRVGISSLDLGQRRLSWQGFPSIDRPLAKTEKNWAVFAGGDRLFLLYSFAPYVLLAADNWPALTFRTVLEDSVELPFAGDGLHVRNSINPVDYDAGHWLHVVHKVYPGKQYCFWAVLIDKQTLRPVMTTARPLVCGWQSASASILYACSVGVTTEHVNIFAGLDDSATAVATIARGRLDSEWSRLPQ